MLLCCLCFIASLHVLLYIILEVSCVQYTSYVCTVHEQLVLLAQVVKGAPAAAASSRSRRTQLVLTVWLLLGWFPLLVVISRIGLFDCCSFAFGGTAFFTSIRSARAWTLTLLVLIRESEGSGLGPLRNVVARPTHGTCQSRLVFRLKRCLSSIQVDNQGRSTLLAFGTTRVLVLTRTVHWRGLGLRWFCQRPGP